MKRLLLFATFTGLLLSFTASKPSKALETKELKWYGFNEGYAKAKADKKVVLIDMYTDWCGWCKRMDRDTYGVDSIIKLINKNFIPVKFNPELAGTYLVEGKEYNGQQLRMMMSNNQNTGYPTTYFLDMAKNTIYAEPGYMGPDEFSKLMSKIITASK